MTRPRWAVHPAPVPGTHGAAFAPRHLPVSGRAGREWARFVRAAAERYGTRGTFWREHPLLPRMPIHTWQIWNEENFKYFVARPNPGEYGRLVRRSEHALQAGDPRARLLLGGLFARPGESRYRVKPPQAYTAADFLRLMYRRTPGIASRFDGVALHPYATNYGWLAPQIEETRQVLREAGDARKPLWITELGWSSQHPSLGDSFAKGWRGQARQLRGAFQVLASNQRRWHLRQVFWFSVTDQADSCNFCGGLRFVRPRLPPQARLARLRALRRGPGSLRASSGDRRNSGSSLLKVLSLACPLVAGLFLLLAVPGLAAGSIGLDQAHEVRPKPQLLLFHGGSFLYSDPTFEAETKEAAIDAGFVPYYPSYPLGDLPADLLAARQEARNLREKVGSAVYAYGSSAGGDLAALLAGEGLVSAAVAKAPPSDLVGWEWPLARYGPDYYESIGLSPAARYRLSPIRRPARSPLLIYQGELDTVVPLSMNEAYAEKFPRVQLWTVPGGHQTERLRPWLVEDAMRWLAEIAERQAWASSSE